MVDFTHFILLEEPNPQIIMVLRNQTLLLYLYAFYMVNKTVLFSQKYYHTVNVKEYKK